MQALKKGERETELKPVMSVCTMRSQLREEKDGPGKHNW